MARSAIHYEDVLGSAMTDKRLEVLRSIHQVGSISEAARVNGVSYKAAWQAVETLSNLAGVPLIEKAVGGSGGGGTRLTTAGLEVLHAADILNKARQDALMRIRGVGKSLQPSLRHIVAIGMRTSMRNQLTCIVQDIQKIGGAARVQLRLADGQSLIARITRESLQLLGLRKAMPALALCKASAVTLAPRIVALGGINLLRGTVARRMGAKADRQLLLELSSGLQLAGFEDAVNGLKPGQAAMAAIDESAIVIGLPS